MQRTLFGRQLLESQLFIQRNVCVHVFERKLCQVDVHNNNLSADKHLEHPLYYMLYVSMHLYQS